MIRYWSNRELSQCFHVNLAKWKRWSREFLPPDPLGGLQSGFARQYHPDQAFTVHLGGHLVGTLKFSVPEARRILADMEGWLNGNGFRFRNTESAGEKGAFGGVHYLIYIARDDAQGLGYLVRGVLGRDRDVRGEAQTIAERITESSLTSEARPFDLLRCNDVRLLNATGLLQVFTSVLHIDPAHFPAVG